MEKLFDSAEMKRTCRRDDLKKRRKTILHFQRKEVVGEMILNIEIEIRSSNKERENMNIFSQEG